MREALRDLMVLAVGWCKLAGERQTEAELEAIGSCVARSQAYGDRCNRLWLDFPEIRQQLMQLAISEKEWNRASKDLQMDGHRPGRPDRSDVDCQRDLRVA
ncbi:MAG: hypothetical protein EA424_11920 [Planctomycetaceae bacterium]|nr:MAG: hypothetical protein EA424_11920 [Planctomycetaceae bacterium]